jgi:hypothetical protein
MAIIRELAFFSGKTYHIAETLVKMTNIQMGFTVPAQHLGDLTRLEAIREQIATFFTAIFIDPDEFIPDPITGIFTPVDLWFHRWGVEWDGGSDYFDRSIGSYTVDTTPDPEADFVFDLEGEESILDDIIPDARVLMVIEVDGSELLPIDVDEDDVITEPEAKRPRILEF